MARRTLAVDVDTHEMIPFHMWAQEFGAEIAAKLAACEHSPFFADNGSNTSVRPDIVADNVEIAPEVVALAKGCSAPGAIDMRRRSAVMDAMGVERSLVFPSFGLVGFLMANSPEWVAAVMGIGLDAPQTRQAGLEVIKASNDWAVRAFEQLDGRVRPVGLVLTESADQMTRDLIQLIEQGIGAVWIPSGHPPAGTSEWAAVFPNALRGVLSGKPSEYLARNVRVAPFHFEPIDEFMERHPQLAGSYCFSSDYPHVEGGPNARQVFAGRLARLGPQVAEKFFRTNGEWLLP